MAARISMVLSGTTSRAAISLKASNCFIGPGRPAAAQGKHEHDMRELAAEGVCVGTGLASGARVL